MLLMFHYLPVTISGINGGIVIQIGDMAIYSYISIQI